MVLVVTVPGNAKLWHFFLEYLKLFKNSVSTDPWFSERQQSDQIIKILHECEVLIEKSVPRVTVWCWVSRGSAE